MLTPYKAPPLLVILNMSSFKKAIPKRKYRERSQPAHRQHLGLLEKKRDYKLRSEDTHKKEKILKDLHEKVLNKNPDEFYFGMQNTRVIGGKHRKESQFIEPEKVKKQKILDGNLLNMKMMNKISQSDKLKESLHLIDAPAPNKHIIFVDNADKLEKFDLAKHFDTVPELVNNKSNRLTVSQLSSMKLKEYPEPEGYQELEALAQEEKIVSRSLEKNILSRKLLGKEKYKVIDEEKKQYKWFRERKR